MSDIRLYVDEDSMRHALVRGLRARHVDVRTAMDDGMLGRTDEDQLRWASAQRRALYTYNVADLHRLHSSFIRRGEVHAGIILVPQRRYGIGDQVRGVLRLIAARSAESMERQAEFLSAWIERMP